MKVESANTPPLTESRLLWRCGLIAFAIEATLLTALGWQNHWLAHPQKTKGLDDSKYLQTEMYRMPEKAELISHQVTKTTVAHETTLSKVVGKGRTAKPNEKPLQEENQVKQGTGETTNTPSHGPVAVFNPSPVIPSYLQNKDLNTSVVIEFLISAQGVVTPRLLASSGNEELDAIALSTAKKWQFRPAEQDHKALDAKVRLRIVFEVH